jgi:hypothetical protein
MVRVERPPDVVGAGTLRFTLKTTVASFKDVVLQEVKGIPLSPEWSVLFDEAPVAELRTSGLIFNKEQEEYRGQGSVEFDPKAPSCEYRWRIADCASRFTVEVRGQRVAEFHSGEESHVATLRVRGETAEVLYNGVAISRDVKLPKGTGPIRISVAEGDAEIRNIFWRPLR